MSKVTLTIEDGIAILGMGRPEAMNTLNREIVDEIDAAVEDVKKNVTIRVLILYNFDARGNFAAGADIKGMVNCNEEEAKAFAFSDTFNKIAGLKIPTIAAIGGYALGGGLELALTCDLRVAARNAKMGFPETGLGIMPGAGGTIRAPRLLGEAKALELILLGTIINAEEALRIGLVNQIAEPEALLDTAMKWAVKLANGAPTALEVAKETVRAGMLAETAEEGVRIEAENWAKLFNTEDQKEGMTAFIEKRKPEYRGK